MGSLMYWATGIEPSCVPKDPIQLLPVPAGTAAALDVQPVNLGISCTFKDYMELLPKRAGTTASFELDNVGMQRKNSREVMLDIHIMH